MRIVGSYRVIGQLSQEIGFLTRRKQLEVPEADERLRHPADHGARLRCRVTVIEHVPHDLLARQHEAQGTGGGDAQVMHGFGAEKFPHGRAKHRQAVGRPRVGRGAGALELQHPALAAAADHLAEVDCPAIAELTRPVAELMPTVAGGVRIHAGKHTVAGENFRK